MGGRSFKDLEIWKKGRELRNEIFHLVKTFPSIEKFNLSDQLLRSSRSICTNIAEGHGRYHFQENIQFCRISRGSLLETQDHLVCAFDCSYISDTVLKEYEEKILDLTKMING